MKKFRADNLLLLAVVLAAITAGFWFLRSTPSREPLTKSAPTPAIAQSTESATESITPQLAAQPQAPRLSAAPNASVVSDRPRFVAETSAAQHKAAETDPQLLAAASAVRDYRIAFRQNPTGNNAEITRALLGKNSRNIRYLPPNAQLSEKNELTDRWNQPVFFHQISGTLMEIRSAGPDHKMWTEDDEVSR